MDVGSLLPPDEYVVIRTTLSTGRVVLLCVPESVDGIEALEIQREIARAAEQVSARAPDVLN